MSPRDPVAEIAFNLELRRLGRITGVIGMLLEADGLPQRVGVGGRCIVLAQDDRRRPCDVVGGSAGRTPQMPFGDVSRVGVGDTVEPADWPLAQLTALLEAPR